MSKKTMHCLTVVVGLEEGREVGVDVIGMDVGVELGVADGCKKTELDITAERIIYYCVETSRTKNQCIVSPSPWAWKRGERWASMSSGWTSGWSLGEKMAAQT